MSERTVTAQGPLTGAREAATTGQQQHDLMVHQ
jgi:hypothetical protein